MPRTQLVMRVPIVETPRVKQLQGLFDVAPAASSDVVLDVDLPIEDRPWQIGLIVGRSGAGKSSVARELFGNHLVTGFDWPADKSILDGFPAEMGIKDVTGLLSSVGFSSPPSWLRPFRCLSNGEQFRVTMARALAEAKTCVVMDEFTSVIDRTVAKMGCVAISKAVRRRQQQFVAVACHYDIVDWLDPDWIYEPEHNRFQWRLERGRPPVRLTIVRVHHSAWKLFKRYHYLTAELCHASHCYVATMNGQPVAFSSVMFTPPTSLHEGYYREHRTVCIPDFQGVGIGNAVSEFVASLYVATGLRFCSTTGNPGMITHRHRSPLWKMHRKPGLVAPIRNKGTAYALRRRKSASSNRMTAGFTYIGPARPYEAARFGLKTPPSAASNSGGTGPSPKRPRHAKPSGARQGFARIQQKGPIAKGSSATSASSCTSTSSTTATTTPVGT